MTTLTTSLEPRSEAFRANAAAMRGVVEDLRAKTETIALGGDEPSRQRHLSRGKLLARDRVRKLLDP
ncbi:MAG TPA: methylcrotonoyl-CoA carboxylase, partial [Stellaceae bacterium]|nr:methylcrotonoyl-CoA carboxylase [Stellaceae bacterium]